MASLAAVLDNLREKLLDTGRTHTHRRWELVKLDPAMGLNDPKHQGFPNEAADARIGRSVTSAHLRNEQHDENIRECKRHVHQGSMRIEELRRDIAATEDELADNLKLLWTILRERANHGNAEKMLEISKIADGGDEDLEENDPGKNLECDATESRDLERSRVEHIVEILDMCSFRELKEVERVLDKMLPGGLRSCKRPKPSGQPEAEVLQPLPRHVGLWI